MLHADSAIESTNDYYARQSKHYEAHREEEDYPQLWEEICKYWTDNISGTKDMSSKAMVGRVMSCRDTFTRAVTISLFCLFLKIKSLYRRKHGAMLRASMYLGVSFIVEMTKPRAKLRASLLVPHYVWSWPLKDRRM